MAAAAEVRLLVSDAQNLSATRSLTDDYEFDLLLACCSKPSRADRIRGLLSRPLNWERLLALVDHHRVVPQVYGELSTCSRLMPAQFLDALRLRYQENARKTLWFAAELVRVLRHLEAAGIQALPYKGPVLAQALYGEVTQRQFGDLDILILPKDVPKAKAALRDLGYTLALDLPQEIEAVYLETGYEYSFSAMRGQNLLEMQWRIVPRFYSIDFDVEDFFDRAEEITLGGFSMRTLRDEDLFLVLCVHAAKHVWVQLSWLCDIAELGSSQDLDWNAIQSKARLLGIERIVGLNLLLAQRLLGTPLPHMRCEADSRTTALADEILGILRRSAHYDTESIPYFRLVTRLRERWQVRARFLWRLALTPSVSEWSTIRFPKVLHPLYHLVRVSRLARKLMVNFLKG
jgi:hypothetical protein